MRVSVATDLRDIDVRETRGELQVVLRHGQCCRTLLLVIVPQCLLGDQDGIH